MSGTQSGTPAEAGSGVEQAAASIEAILDRDNGTPDAPRKAPVPRREPSARSVEDAAPPEAEPDPRETLAEDDDGERDDIFDPPESEEDGTDEATDDDAEDDADDYETKTFTVKIDGKDVRVTGKELRDGYLRQSDYTKKTMALSENDKRFRQHVAAVRSYEEELRVERAQYAELLPVLHEQYRQLSGQIGEPDPALINSDPIEYTRQRAAYDDLVRKQQAAAQEGYRLHQLNERERQQQRAELLAHERELVIQKIPAWAPPERWAKVVRTARAYAEEQGYTPEQIGEVTDHRAVIALWKAARYDETMRKGAPVPDRPRSTAAPPPQPGPAPARRRQSVHNQNIQRLAKTHSVADAASVIRGLL